MHPLAATSKETARTEAHAGATSEMLAVAERTAYGKSYVDGSSTGDGIGDTGPGMYDTPPDTVYYEAAPVSAD